MKIVAIGDSITEGYPFSPRESWAEHVSRELNVPVINRGICGDLTRGMRDRFRQDVLALVPSHVIILGGANDAFAGFPLAGVSQNFSAMADKCRQHEIIPILGLPTPSLLPAEENLLKEYRDWIKDYAWREQIPVIDFYAPFLYALNNGLEDQLFVDEVHPSIEGYKLMGETAVRCLSHLLSLDPGFDSP